MIWNPKCIAKKGSTHDPEHTGKHDGCRSWDGLAAPGVNSMILMMQQQNRAVDRDILSANFQRSASNQEEDNAARQWPKTHYHHSTLLNQGKEWFRLAKSKRQNVTQLNIYISHFFTKGRKPIIEIHYGISIHGFQLLQAGDFFN